MASIPHYAYFPKDFRADTQHLSFEERGAYRDLMDEMWITDQDNCTIPDDDLYISKLLFGRTDAKAIRRWREIRAVLVEGARPLLEIEGCRLTQTRLRKEMIAAQVKSRKAAASANKRYRLADAEDEIARRKEEKLRTQCGGSANAERTQCGGTASQSQSQIKTETVSKPTSSSVPEFVRDDDASEDESLAAFEAAKAAVPHIHLSRDDWRAWMDLKPDPWWLAAAVWERRLRFANGRRAAYITKAIAELVQEGHDIPSARDYVEANLSRSVATFDATH